MVKTIVRVAEGIAVTAPLLNNLKDLFQQDILLETCSSVPDLQKNYLDRIDIFHQACILISQNIPTSYDKTEILRFFDWCRETTVVPAGLPVNKYQEILTEYTALLAGGISDIWETQDSIQWLNKAEQYVVMRNGRHDLATLSKSLNNSYLILQWDKQLPACSEETLAELEMIKAQGVTQTPLWFKKIQTTEQIYLHSSAEHLKTHEQLKVDVNNLEATWKELRGRYDELNLQRDLLNCSKNASEPPRWYKKMSPFHQMVLSFESGKSLLQVDMNISRLAGYVNQLSMDELQDLDQLRKLPFWFLVLPEFEQRFLSGVLNSASELKDTVNFLNSRLRTVPGLANFAEHHLLKLDEEGNIIRQFHTRLRSSHPASRDVLDMNPVVADLHSERNLAVIARIADGKPFLVQTLISPVPLVEPDCSLDAQRMKEVSSLHMKGYKIFSTNHPLNVAKRLYPTASTNEACLALYTAASKMLEKKELEAKASSLCPGNKLFSRLMLAAVFFTQENASQQGLELFNIFKNNPIDWKDVPVADIKKQLNKAFNTAGILYSEDRQLPPLNSEASEQEKRQQALLSMFMRHYSSFIAWQGFQRVMSLASQWYAIGPQNAEKLFNQLLDVCSLMQLTMDYHALLNSPYGSGTVTDYNGRELFLSSLEHLLIVHMEGVSYGTCVSGKDRKALELLHTSAMMLHFDDYGIWPSYFDKGLKRNLMVTQAANLYLTRHAHVHANQNAPGSEGIKHSFMYFPGDIAEKIAVFAKNYDYLKRDDILATNNEPKYIGDLKFRKKPQFTFCVMASLRIDKNLNTKYLCMLKEIVEEKGWSQQKSGMLMQFFAPATPQGIEDMRRLFAKIDRDVMASVFYEVCQRPETSFWRSKLTQSLYDSICRIFESQSPNDVIEAELTTLATLKAELNGSNNLVNVI